MYHDTPFIVRFDEPNPNKLAKMRFDDLDEAKAFAKAKKAAVERQRDGKIMADYTD